MPGSPADTKLLEVEDLRIEFFARAGRVQAVRGVTFDVHAGETLGLVGESGSGKSVTSQALLGIIESPGRLVTGDIRWKGDSLVHGPAAKQLVKRVRGQEMAMVFQDPMSSLNPLLKVGTQIVEVLRHHLGMPKAKARDRAVELLDLVGIPAAQQRAKQFPWEFSGGMQQRVLIAMALACEPALLIADEPTTALDVTIQDQIFELLANLKSELGLAILLITHDLGVVAEMCDRVAVMYAGRLLEDAAVDVLYRQPASPYTAGLLRAMPRLDVARARLDAIEGNPPDLKYPPSGCGFHPRCPHATSACTETEPVMIDVADRRIACWNPLSVSDPAEPSSVAEVGHG